MNSRNGLWIFPVLLGGLSLFCSTPIPTTVVPNTITPPPTIPVTVTSTPVITQAFYVSLDGDDAGPGTLDQPWKTLQKAVESLRAGEAVFIRGGEYDGIRGGWVFQNSGTQSMPIVLMNYPNEQVIFRIRTVTEIDRYLFRCSINPRNPISWQTPKADHIRILGSDVTPRMLSNGVESEKGIVMLGMEGQQSAGIYVSDCDHWEVAGVDFVETAAGIFTEKNNWSLPDEHSTDSWYVHDNRVYNYYRESGMQFNGNFNLIENNEIYKVSDRLDSPHGCQLLNLLGNNNVVRGNALSRLGSTAECIGIGFEWDLADANHVVNNTISDVPMGIVFQGGDKNLIQGNTLQSSVSGTGTGVWIASYSGKQTWPCNDYVGSGGSVEAILPPNDPLHPDYPFYFNPRNCLSMNNRIIENTIIGFEDAWMMVPLVEESNVFLNNIVVSP